MVRREILRRVFGNAYRNRASPPLMTTVSVPPGNTDAAWSEWIPLANASNPVVFQYGPGVYQTTGWKFGKVNTAGSYVTHQGADMYATTIQLTGTDGTPGTGVIFGGDWSWPSHWSCFDMTLDIGINGFRPASAINFWGGDNIVVQGVRFINFGTRTVLLECFPLIIASPNRKLSNLLAPGPIDYITIDGCVFERPMTGNTDGCTMIAVNDNANGNVSIGPHCFTSNCRFLDCRSDFSYLHCVGNVRVTDNIAINSGVFWYAEPAQAQYTGVECLVDNNVVIGGEALVYINPRPQASVWIKIGTGNVCK